MTPMLREGGIDERLGCSPDGGMLTLGVIRLYQYVHTVHTLTGPTSQSSTCPVFQFFSFLIPRMIWEPFLKSLLLSGGFMPFFPHMYLGQVGSLANGLVTCLDPIENFRCWYQDLFQ